MAAQLLMTLMLMVTYVISLQCVDAYSLRKASPSDDVTGHDVTSRDTVIKRSATEVRGKRRAYSAPAVVGVPVMLDRSASRSTRPVADTWSLPSDGQRSQFASLLADALLLEHLRHRRPTGHHPREMWATPYGQLDDEDLIRIMEEANGLVYGTGNGRSALAGPELFVKRTTGHLRSPRELHPVYLGLGQNAASAALDTYASLLADEKRRESLEQQQQSSANPVSFIGKR